jgi:hypothetical protein
MSDGFIIRISILEESWVTATNRMFESGVGKNVEERRGGRQGLTLAHYPRMGKQARIPFAGEQ